MRSKWKRPGFPVLAAMIVSFECTRCGKCCISSGTVIRVDKRLTERSFECCCLAGGERFIAVIEPGGMLLYRGAGLAAACPFLRMQGRDAVCTIYSSRPEYCRKFQCFSFIIHKDGRETGRVKGKRRLDTRDPVLRALWDADIAPLTLQDEGEWRARVAEILCASGYRIEP